MYRYWFAVIFFSSALNTMFSSIALVIIYQFQNVNRKFMYNIDGRRKYVIELIFFSYYQKLEGGLTVANSKLSTLFHVLELHNLMNKLN